ncbi:UbiX family flavin prenyltransferase [Rhodomicrobium lacus]|jgi:4-hydroxy-3-polyprenylbenzoate decarboxylase|uniref:UbiX family flavin prenyltransferase n=1 Tax=Rhodomicrobium TaxID=1068 RepID=UPI0026E2CEC5|nr:UbiX family flavin prenyltransferase [Rhodomicrobium lacus]WKW50130.1 UbiX family flavin prenyltransferase [Rhodomicrobium lacus]
MEKRRLIVGISGATGFQFGIRALELLRELGVETHLVMSKGAEMTRHYETDLKSEDVHALADVVHPIGNLGATISSGSFRTMGMLVAPCSMRTLGAIAAGISDNLLTRAADVVLKERRRLVLMTRESPLHLGHLRNMVAVTEIGAVVFPPVPAFYIKPRSIDDLISHTVGRALDMFDLDVKSLRRWSPDKPARADIEHTIPAMGARRAS